jgi:hypothetical protein
MSNPDKNKPLDLNNLSNRDGKKLTEILGRNLPNALVLDMNNSEERIKYLIHDGEYFEGKPYGNIPNINGYKIHCANNTPCGRWWVQDNGEGLIGYISSPKNSTDKNIGRNIVSNMIEAYKFCGVSKINLHAGYKVGPYFWAKCGATPTWESWKGLRQILDKKLDSLIDKNEIDKDKQGGAIKIARRALRENDPKAIWSISDSDIGKVLLSNEHNHKLENINLPDTTWVGQIDLNDKKVRERLETYLSKGKHVDRLSISGISKGMGRGMG